MASILSLGDKFASFVIGLASFIKQASQLILYQTVNKVSSFKFKNSK